MRHFYWAVTSTQECLGKVKVAKFQAFLSHVTNKHKDLPNRLFNACVHGDVIRPKVWMSKGSKLVDGKSQFFTVLIFLDVTTLSKNYYRIMIMLT